MSKRRKRKQRKQKYQKKQHSASYLSEALSSLRQGNLNAAATLASKVVQITNTASEVQQAQAILAETHFRNAVNNQDSQKKLTDLTASLKSAPTDTRLHFHRGIALLQKGKAAEALKEFNLVAKTEPEREGLAYFQQLACLASKKPLRETQHLSPAETNTLTLIKEFQRRPSLKIAENLPEGPLLGDSRMWNVLLKLRHDKKFTQTELLKEFIISGKPKSISAILQYYQGIAAMRADRPEAARQLWQQALSKKFATKWSQKNLGFSMHQKLLMLVEAENWGEIVNRLRRLPSTLNDKTLDQIAGLTFFHLGCRQAEQGKWKQAIKYWSEAAQKANNCYLAQNIALAWEQLEQWVHAAEAWREMLRLRPRKEEHAGYLTPKQASVVWQHVAECYLNAYMEQNAVDCFYKAVEHDPENLALRFRLVSMLMGERYGNPEAAAQELTNILKRDPENIEALTHLAHIYRELGYDTIQLWKKVVALEPDNAEARYELAQSYIQKVLPENESRRYFWRKTPYKKQLDILHEALEILPDYPDLVFTLAVVYMEAKKKKQAQEQFWRAYQLAPQDTQLVSDILQNLIHVKADKLMEEIIPEIRTITGLLPGFWVDQGATALDHLSWARRFFDEALEQLNYTDKATRASVLVDICMAIPANGKHRSLRDTYIKTIEREVPQSGALEYLEGFLIFARTHNVSKARRLIQRAKKLAIAANDTGMLQHIDMAEHMLSISPNALMDMLFGMDKGLLEELMEKIGGFDDGDFF